MEQNEFKRRDQLELLDKRTDHVRKAKVVNVDEAAGYVQVRFLDGKREYFSFKPENPMGAYSLVSLRRPISFGIPVTKKRLRRGDW